MVFDGIVLGPDGRPASGVGVVSSAGGKVVTELDGSYRLEVQVPPDAESVDITAVAEDGSGAQTVVTIGGSFTAAGITPVDPLALTNGPGCQPRWLPTFGQPTTDGAITVITTFDDGSGPALFVGGSFMTAGGLATNGIAKREGEGWAALGSGMEGGGLYGTFVGAMTAFDDGSGPALFAGGKFATAGGVSASSIARWNGTSWAALGSGLQGGDSFGPSVHAMTVFDDGGGPALFVGGDFTIAGGVSASVIAKWDGASWAALGSGLEGGTNGPTVNDLAIFDDGGGPALYAAGEFTSAGGVSANKIAKWDGASWTALGSGISGLSSGVRALAAFDDGSGPALYAGGSFGNAGGVTVQYIAKWDGSTWSAVGSGVDEPILTLGVFDDGTGPALYAGGTFAAAGGLVASNIAKWNGSSWSSLGNGVNSTVYALTTFDDGDGPALYTGGSFTVAGGGPAERIAKWDGGSWAGLGRGANDYIKALTVFDDGNGPALYVGGYLTLIGDVPAKRIAKWDGQVWSALGSGIGGGESLHEVAAMTVFDDGGGPALYVGGDFTIAGGSHIAKWDGSTWTSFGGVWADPLETEARVNALAVFDDGSGPALYVGGEFTEAGGVAANHIARWNGSSWSPLAGGMNGPVNALAVFDDGSGPVLVSGSSGGPHHIAQWDGVSWSPMHGGMDRPVRALAVFDDGNGPALYAGGDFTIAGGVAANHIAKWDGASWSALGSGTSGGLGRVWALTGIDAGLGGGPVLYAGGDFTTAGGVTVNSIARWDGTSWSALGTGMDGDRVVHSLTVHGSGGEPALYAGGGFTTAGGVTVNSIAKWDGTSWSALGTGMNDSVFALTVHDDGSGGGAALYAGGFFTAAGGVPANSIARWDGTSWSALGSGMGGEGPLPGPYVEALTVFDDSGGPALYAGGSFTTAGGVPANCIAKWGCDTTPPVLSCPPFVFASDLGSPGEVVTFSVSATDDEPSPTILCVPPSGSFFPRGSTLVTCTATDASGNESTCQFPVVVQVKPSRPR
jgi:hypothetical protein